MTTQLPPMTETPKLYVDATPDKEYPLRILKAYRQDCDCKWASDTDGTLPDNPILKMMNEHNDQRAKYLDKAIRILKEQL